MTVFFKNKKLAKSAADLEVLDKNFGQSGRWIGKCIAVLKAVPNLAELFRPAHKRYRCHLLRNDKYGKYSLDERDPYRVLFKPVDPVPYKPGTKEIDAEKVDTVVVTDLHINTHE